MRLSFYKKLTTENDGLYISSTNLQAHMRHFTESSTFSNLPAANKFLVVALFLLLKLDQISSTVSSKSVNSMSKRGFR
jgi:hypothetical protein